MSDPTTPQPAPMRVVRAWLFRERALRGPGAIELDVLDRQVTREQQQVGLAAGESARIERRLQRVRERVRAALVDRRTPGLIDATETRGIARELVGTSVAAHHHTRRLDGLV